MELPLILPNADDGTTAVRRNMLQLTIQQAFDLALQHHQSGRLHEAEQLYRQILAQQPRHIDAIHHLGVLAHQVGRNDIAVYLIRQAIALEPRFPEAHSNLGTALKESGHLDDAITAYRHAIELRPAYAEAHNNLGHALQRKGQLDRAIESYRVAIAIMPGLPEAHSNLAGALTATGRLEEATSAARSAIALRPEYAQAHSNLGDALQSQGRIEEAIAAYHRAIALKPDDADAYNNLGNAFRIKGDFDAAIQASRQALKIRPDIPEALNNLGNALSGKGQFDEAIAAYHQAIAIKPDLSESHSNLGNTLKEMGRTEEAIDSYRRAITLNPTYADAQFNLANALSTQGQLDEATTAYRRAIELKPDFAQAYTGLANALKINGELDSSIAAYRRAMELNPKDSDNHSGLLLAMHYHPALDAQAVAEEHRRWNTLHAEPAKELHEPQIHLGPAHRDRSPERRLRIGYVSPDFRDHAVASFLLPLLANHDHESVEVFAYAQVRRPDAMTERLRACTDQWRDSVGLSDAQLADQIRHDEIDILVDLAGHTAGNRLLLFACKPAPVQMTYLGYPSTTGLSSMDYRLTDSHADPPGMTEPYHSEQLIRLDPCAWCYEAVSNPPMPPRSDGPVTFGCFNNFAKITEPMLRTWGQILSAVPASKLLLKAKALTSPRVCESVLQVLESEQVSRDRVELLGWDKSEAEHLSLYGRVSIGLDPFPYNGTTTTCEAMWMGVPVVTLAGNSHVSRVGVSLLTNLNLADLIAQTPEAYVKIAVDLANDLPRMRDLHSTLRQQMAQSPLTDAPKFVRRLEAAYRQVWRNYCSGDRGHSVQSEPGWRLQSPP